MAHQFTENLNEPTTREATEIEQSTGVLSLKQSIKYNAKALILPVLHSFSLVLHSVDATANS